MAGVLTFRCTTYREGTCTHASEPSLPTGTYTATFVPSGDPFGATVVVGSSTVVITYVDECGQQVDVTYDITPTQ
jgi:hypothetical protein